MASELDHFDADQKFFRDSSWCCYSHGPCFCGVGHQSRKAWIGYHSNGFPGVKRAADTARLFQIDPPTVSRLLAQARLASDHTRCHAPGQRLSGPNSAELLCHIILTARQSRRPVAHYGSDKDAPRFFGRLEPARTTFGPLPKSR